MGINTDWILIPKIGTRVKAKHPITCLNPSEFFEVSEIRINKNEGIFVRGEKTCWFSLNLIEKDS